MKMARGWTDLFAVVQGEGHPFLWYIMLRAGHLLSDSKMVLPAVGLLVGIAAVAVLVFRSPFRLLALAIMIFSLSLGYEYVVVSRNYGVTALIIFALAASWQRTRDSGWLGLGLLLLCNTNVPSLFLAGSLYLYRMLELRAERVPLWSGPWRRWLWNGILLGLGALLCFVAVYPPAHDAAVSEMGKELNATNLFMALISSKRAFIDFGLGQSAPWNLPILLVSLLIFARQPKALVTALICLLGLKLFFYFVYPGYYRHSSLFFLLMISLVWIEASKRGQEGTEPAKSPLAIGSWAFLFLLSLQTALYVRKPVYGALTGVPLSRAADFAELLQRPDLRDAIVMVDPDTLGESIAYQIDRPVWLLRQQRLGTVSPLSSAGIKVLTLDTILAQAKRLHDQTGKPVVIALMLPIDYLKTPRKWDLIFGKSTVITKDGVIRFNRETRHIATLRRAAIDEVYDVYVFPR